MAAVVVRPDYRVAGAVRELGDLSDLIHEPGSKVALTAREPA